MEKLITKRNIFLIGIASILIIVTSYFIIQNNNKDEEKLFFSELDKLNFNINNLKAA